MLIRPLLCAFVVAGALASLAPAAPAPPVTHPGDVVVTVDARFVPPTRPTVVHLSGSFRFAGAYSDSGRVSGTVRKVGNSWRYTATLRGSKGTVAVEVIFQLRRATLTSGWASGVVRSTGRSGEYAGQRTSGRGYCAFSIDQNFFRLVALAQRQR